MSALTSEQIEFFHQNGYIAIGKILEDEHIEILRREYDREFAAARKNNRFRNLAISNTDDLSEKNDAPHKCCRSCKCVSAICTTGNSFTMTPYSILPSRSSVQIFNSSTIRRSSNPHITGMRFSGIKTMGTGNVCLPISSHAGSLWMMPM